MSKFLSELNFYPQILMDAADDENGGNGGDENDDGDQDKGDDTNSDQKSLIDKDKILGDKKDDENSDDGDREKEGDQEKKDDEKAERPEYIKEKFWDPEKGEIRGEALSKAYDDLEKKLGNNNKAPDEYKVDLDDDAKKIFHEEDAEKDPLLNWFKDYAKENNFSQEMFNEALNGFAEKSAEFLKQTEVPEINREEEVGKLGKNAEAIIENQTQFLSQLYKQGRVDEGQVQELMILTETADGIKALQALRAHYGEQQSIPMNLNAGGGVKTADELRAMQADPKYGNDPEYTSTVDKEYEKKYGTGTSGESQRSAL